MNPRLLVGLLLAVLAAHMLHYGICTQDDAFISFRYAANLIGGDGLVYNAGEPVEGYTNFLWTVLLAGAMAIGLNPVIASVLGGLIAHFCDPMPAVLAERAPQPRLPARRPALLAPLG